MPSYPGPSTYHPAEPVWHTLVQFDLPSQPGSENQARAQVTEVVRSLNLTGTHLERLKTAVTEATLNAIEHGNRSRPDIPVTIRVLVSEKNLLVRITGGGSDPLPPPEKPDLAAQLTGQQPPRGWGFFLIEKAVDELRVQHDGTHHTIELFLYREEGNREE